ncbi:MAG: hypothetical protein ACI8P0_000928 [Planctomycetaceae bacterium]|jgi:hypothetical protein
MTDHFLLQRVSLDELPALLKRFADEEAWMHRCPKCESLLIESLLILTSRTDRPGWRTVMSSVHRPTWYDDG